MPPLGFLNTFFVDWNRSNCSSSKGHLRMKPFSASFIAGAITSCLLRRPCFSSAYNVPATVPGTPTARGVEMLSPLIKAPIEKATGKSLFYGTDISDRMTEYYL